MLCAMSHKKKINFKENIHLQPQISLKTYKCRKRSK